MVKMFNIIPMEPHSETVKNIDLKKNTVADILKWISWNPHITSPE